VYGGRIKNESGPEETQHPLAKMKNISLGVKKMTLFPRKERKYRTFSIEQY